MSAVLCSTLTNVTADDITSFVLCKNLIETNHYVILFTQSETVLLYRVITYLT